MRQAPDTALEQARCRYVLRLADTSLVLGQRLGEWIGQAPALEEDLALANLSLDLIGQARLLLTYAGELEGRGRDEDALAFLRDAPEFVNLTLAEQPNGDFGHTLMRQFLFDAFHFDLLKGLTVSSDPRIAEIAQKAAKEAAYHLERSSDLVIRLGDGTPESHHRMQNALDALWSYTGEMFVSDEKDAEVAARGLIPDPASLKGGWQQTVREVLNEAALIVPESAFAHKGGKRGVHTEHLGYILADMQFLQRAYPGSTW